MADPASIVSARTEEKKAVRRADVQNGDKNGQTQAARVGNLQGTPDGTLKSVRSGYAGGERVPNRTPLERTPIHDYLERSTVRRETAIPGSSGSAAGAQTAAYASRSAAARAGEHRGAVANAYSVAGAAQRDAEKSAAFGRGAGDAAELGTSGTLGTGFGLLQEYWPGDATSDRAAGKASGKTVARSRQKTGKMHDQNAQAIERTLAERSRAEREKAEKAAAAASKPRSQAAKLMLALGITIALGVGLYFAIPEVTRVQKVTVNGRSSMSEQEIVDALQLSPEVNLVNADLPSMEKRILSNPKVSAVRIRRGFPDRLVIYLAERTPVACVLVSDAFGTRPIAIDVDGVAFAAMDEITTDRKVPILSGIRFENYKPGQRLPAFLHPLLSDIAALLDDNPSVLDAFSEIKIEKVSGADAELVLYPKGKNVPVRMPLRLTKANLGSALLVLDILSGRPDADMIQELDFRSGTIVYRTKEAQPG